MLLRFTFTLLLSLAAVVAVAQETWPRFRGPNGLGRQAGASPDVAWGEATPLWTAKLPGRGHGSPVVWRDKLFVTSGDDKNGATLLLSFDAKTGQEIWRQELAGETYSMHAFNSYGSSTPAVDGERVVISTGSTKTMHVAAFSHDGKPLWNREFAGYESSHGFGSSPILVNGLACLADDQMGDSSLIAINLATGDTAWQTPRPAGKAAYGTPCLLGEKSSGQQIIALSTAAGVAAFDVKSGEQAWQLTDVFSQRVVGSPLIAGNLLLATCGSGGSGKRLVAVKLPANGSEPELVYEPELAYELTRGVPYVPTPIAVGELLFLWHDGGMLTCVELATGETVWRERIGGKYFASPVQVGDAICNVSTDGELVAVAAGRDYKLLGKQALGEPSNATPAIANQRLYVRTESKLYCFGTASFASRSHSGSK